MNISATVQPTLRPAIVRHIATDDLLHLYRDGRPDYKRIAELVKLSKTDLSKISRVAKSSVRFDANIPEPVAEQLREIANIAAHYVKTRLARRDCPVCVASLWPTIPRFSLHYVSGSPCF